MKVPIRWIQEIFPNALSADEIAEKLTQLGLEVEEVETIRPAFTGVVVAKVLEVENHPEADRLRIAKVTDGEQQVQVVCGAPNCRAGLTVAFAKEGAVLGLDEEKPLKVKKSKIRGTASFGMLCSEKELGFSENHEGICELNPSLYTLGEDFSTRFTEQVLEVSLTPNLAHCFSILGIAKELKAAIGGEITLPEFALKEENTPAAKLIQLQIANDRCRKYTCRVLKNVRVGPSPDWLKKKLELVGQRSVNNVVDITNFVMLELGQPLHAFDLEKIAGGKLFVRTANENEKIKTLDEEERRLHPEDLLICDEKGPIALAGVMGGSEAEVSDSTVSILLESAWFDPISIRKSSKRHALSTEASKRFERGIDPLNIERALDYAAALIQKTTGAEVLQGVVKEEKKAYLPKELSLRVSKLNSLLGTSLSVSEVQQLLTRLDFKANLKDENTFIVHSPSWRVDIVYEEDLIEEVARLYGYHNLRGEKKSASYDRPQHTHSQAYLLEREVRSRLLSLGLVEFVTCSLIGPKLLEIVQGMPQQEEGMVKVLNPTSSEQSLLRTSLLPGILQVVKHNIDRRNLDIAGFEVGRTHFRTEEAFCEEMAAAVVLTGRSAPSYWGEKGEEANFFLCKGIVESFFSAFGGKLSFSSSSLPSFHPGQQAHILLEGKEIGVIGALHPYVLRRLDVEQKVFYAEWNLAPLHTLLGVEKKMKPLPQFPGSERDWTVTLHDVSWKKVTEIVKKAPSKFLDSFTLIDRYVNAEKLGEGRANLTIRFFYRHPKRTIEQEEVDKEHQRILTFVQKQLAEEEVSQ